AHREPGDDGRAVWRAVEPGTPSGGTGGAVEASRRGDAAFPGGTWSAVDVVAAVDAGVAAGRSRAPGAYPGATAAQRRPAHRTGRPPPTECRAAGPRDGLPCSG